MKALGFGMKDIWKAVTLAWVAWKIPCEHIAVGSYSFAV